MKGANISSGEVVPDRWRVAALLKGDNLPSLILQSWDGGQRDKYVNYGRASSCSYKCLSFLPSLPFIKNRVEIENNSSLRLSVVGADQKSEDSLFTSSRL